MARIVLVHGAFNELWGPNELKARWLPALCDGLWHHGVEITADDVGVCFYGDLFRRAPGTEAEAKLELARPGIADAISQFAGEDGLAALGAVAGEAILERTVDLVAVMTTEPDLRDRIRKRMEAVVDGDTRVVVGHSLGSVVSYLALRTHPEWDVDTLVTLGSPLGAPMTQQLTTRGGEDGTAWPGSVRRWVNIRAVSDKACAKPLQPMFGDRVEEHLIDNGHRAHAPEPYLNAAPTGAAIAAALGAPR